MDTMQGFFSIINSFLFVLTFSRFLKNLSDSSRNLSTLSALDSCLSKLLQHFNSFLITSYFLFEIHLLESNLNYIIKSTRFVIYALLHPKYTCKSSTASPNLISLSDSSFASSITLTTLSAFSRFFVFSVFPIKLVSI